MYLAKFRSSDNLSVKFLEFKLQLISDAILNHIRLTSSDVSNMGMMAAPY